MAPIEPKRPTEVAPRPRDAEIEAERRLHLRRRAGVAVDAAAARAQGAARAARRRLRRRPRGTAQPSTSHITRLKMAKSDVCVFLPRAVEIRVFCRAAEPGSSL